MTRITMILFWLSLAAGAEGYIVFQPLPLPYRILHLYALAEPTPSQLLYVMLSPSFT